MFLISFLHVPGVFEMLVVHKCIYMVENKHGSKSLAQLQIRGYYYRDTDQNSGERLNFKDGVFMLCLVCGSVQLNPSSMTAACGSSGHV